MDGLTLLEVYVGSEKIWPTRETVQITLGDGFAARDAFRAALAARGLDYATVTELPFDIELVGSGNAQLLFYGCSALTSIPPFDMSQVTNANGMFQLCSSLVTVPPLDTRNVWNAPSMFAYCSSLTSVPTMNAAKMTNVTNMFTGCRVLTDGNVLLTNRNPAVDSTGMISGSGLTREPWDTATPPVSRKVTIKKTTVMSDWDRASATGDTGLIQGWGKADEVQFQTAVTCNQSVYSSDSFIAQDPGTILRAGVLIKPYQAASYIFTEVL